MPTSKDVGALVSAALSSSTVSEDDDFRQSVLTGVSGWMSANLDCAVGLCAALCDAVLRATEDQRD